MKKCTFLLIVSIVVSSFTFAQKVGVWKNRNNGRNHNLVLTHPTVSNLKTIKNLVTNKLITLKNYRFIGVYHADERYNYENSVNYLDTASFQEIEFYLHEIQDTINEDLLYKKNALIHDFRKIFKHSEGVLFFGGPDLPPDVYNEKTSLHTSVYDPYRHYFELSFLFHLLGGNQNKDMEPLLRNNPDYLIYGFCLGMQTMNVATGGTMVQDIPSEIYNMQYVENILKMDPNRLHRNYYNRINMQKDLLSGHFHRIHLKSSPYPNKLDLDNTTPSVYSNHHQAVDDIGKGFQVRATSLDGKIVEMLQHKQYDNVIGVQFHPEAAFLYDDEQSFRFSPEDTASFTGQQILQENHSLEFHQKFWSDFQRRLKE